MTSIYQKFLKKEINLAPLGVAKHTDDITYFCTPKGANIIGWAGVDGIHYCFIRGFGEMIFAVSPMNIFPDYVHPIAENFSDFLRLLLSCGDCAVLEQAWQWDKAQFETFLKEYPPSDEQKAILSELAEKMNLTPLEQPWQYIKEVQSNFDYSKIKYTEDLYDLDMNPDMPTPEWKVWFEGGFWTNGKGHGHAGKEIPVGKHFEWANHDWIIPSMYSCSKGLVIDFCMKINPAEIESFMEKWDLNIENEAYKTFSTEEKMQLEQENPLSFDFSTILYLNRKELHQTHGYGLTWNPCVPSGYVRDIEAAQALEHYGLDADFGWIIRRFCYPWATKKKPEMKILSLSLIQQKMPVPGPHFQVKVQGDTFRFVCPIDKGEYTLTVQEYEPQILKMRDDEWEYPTHHYVMSYTITPELADGIMTITDCADSDRPIQKQQNPYYPVAVSSASVAVIGGADGPTAIIFGGSSTQGKLRAACSSLHFDSVKDVEWRMIFHQKQFDDFLLKII